MKDSIIFPGNPTLGDSLALRQEQQVASLLEGRKEFRHSLALIMYHSHLESVWTCARLRGSNSVGLPRHAWNRVPVRSSTVFSSRTQ